MQLQKGPIGLLGAFALKVLGRNPTQFGDTITPTIDVFDHYLSSGELQRVGQTITIGIGALTANADQTVPNGKVWRVLGIGAAFVINAADAGLAFASHFSVKSPGGVTLTQIFSANSVGSSTGRTVGFYAGRPLTLPGGWAINFVHTASGAGPTVATAVASGVLVQEFDL